MRRALVERRAKAGHTVRIRLALREGETFARVGLWSAAPGTSDYSPDCPIVPDVDGKPVMVQPRRWTLHGNRPSITLEWTAVESINLRLVQDIDSKNDAAPHAKLTAHGPRIEAVRRFVQNIGRRLRRFYDPARRAIG